MSDCPTEQELRQFLAGDLSPPNRARIELHVAECPRCADRIGSRADPFGETRVATATRLGEPAPARYEQTGHTSDAVDQTAAVQRASPDVPTLAGHAPAVAHVTVEGYRIIREVARGGMGVIYEAVQLKLNRKVALKVLPAVGGPADSPAIARFRREATAAAKLHHTHIVPIYDFGQSGHTYYYAMELVDGQPLSEMVRRFSEGNAPSATNTRLAEMVRGLGPTAPVTDDRSSADSTLSSASRFGSSGTRGRVYYRHVAQWMADAAEALHYAHAQGIIHRDIKPGNLMLCTDGRIMVLDFGLAKSTSEMSVTTTGALVGTLRYMSPEQAMAKRMKVDHRTDIYSLGATMYELLAFQPAFKGADEKETLGLIITKDATPPRKIIADVPREMETICLKTLEKDPNARYATAKDLADDLRRYVQDRPILAKPVGPIGRAIKFARRRRAVTIAGCLVLLLAVTAVLLTQSVRRARKSDRQARALRIDGLASSGKTHYEKKEWEAAEKDYEEILKLDPDNFAALVSLAGAKRYRYGDAAPKEVLDECNALLDRALHLNPHRVQTWNAKGVILRMRGKLDDAIAAHRKGIEIDRTFYANWVSLASVYATKDDLHEAEKCLLQACSLEGAKADIMPWHNLAAVQHQLRKPEALASIDKALALKSGEPTAMLLKARILLDRASKADFKLGLNAAITADSLCGPNHTNARVVRILALAELRNEHWSEAIEAAQRALDLKDQPSWPRLVLAVAEARRGHAGDARGHLDAARFGRPAEFSSQATIVRIEQGLLWFESRRELDQLRAEAERLPAFGP